MTKHYTDEFKQGAVDMVRDQNLTQVEVAKRLGTSSKNIARSRWLFGGSQADKILPTKPT